MIVLLTGLSPPLLRFVGTLIGALAGSGGCAVPEVRLHDPAVEDVTTAAAVQSGELPAVVVIGEPFACLSALLEAGHPPLVAARALTAGAAPLAGWTRRNVVRLRPDTMVGEAATAVLGLIGAAAPGEVGGWQDVSLAAVAARIGDGAFAEPSPFARALIDDVVTPLFEAAASGVPQPVTWSRAMLFWGDRPDEPLPRVIDLTGPARVLAYGPYFHLPAGCWTVCVTLAFSPGAVGAPLAIGLHGGRLLGRGRFKPASPGVFVARLQMEVQSAYAALELRVIAEAGAIEGQIGFDHVRLIPVRA